MASKSEQQSIADNIIIIDMTYILKRNQNVVYLKIIKIIHIGALHHPPPPPSIQLVNKI